VAIAGRSAVSRLRKVVAGAERRAAIDAATGAAAAHTLFNLFADMRGPAMKLGQLLAQSGDLLPEAITEALAGLQWSAPPMHGSLMGIQLRLALGRSPKEVFARFEREPFAAASLGQVHRAWLADGTPLAVKVQYPGIERAIASDFAIVEALLAASRAGRGEGGGSRGGGDELRGALDELRSHILGEADYLREAAAMTELRAALGDRGDVEIPRPYPDLSARRVLTMDLLEGVHIRGYLSSGPSQTERDALASRLLDLFFHQALGLGVFHADPHPGNFLLGPGGRVGLVDFGCVKRLAPDFVAQLKALYRIPPDDAVELDRRYRAIGFYGDASPEAEARRRVLLALQKVDAAKYHDDTPFDFGDGAHLRAIAGCLREMARHGATRRDFVLYMRTKLGHYGLFHQLGARVSCRRVLRAYL